MPNFLTKDEITVPSLLTIHYTDGDKKVLYAQAIRPGDMNTPMTIFGEYLDKALSNPPHLSELLYAPREYYIATHHGHESSPNVAGYSAHIESKEKNFYLQLVQRRRQQAQRSSIKKSLDDLLLLLEQ